MIIFKMVADTYRRLVRKGELTEEQAKKDIRIYDFLAECDQEDLYKLIDSSAFNDIIKAIVKLSLRNIKMDEETGSKILREMDHTFDEMTVKDVYERLV